GSSALPTAGDAKGGSGGWNTSFPLPDDDRRSWSFFPLIGRATAAAPGGGSRRAPVTCHPTRSGWRCSMAGQGPFPSSSRYAPGKSHGKLSSIVGDRESDSEHVRRESIARAKGVPWHGACPRIR